MEKVREMSKVLSTREKSLPSGRLGRNISTFVLGEGVISPLQLSWVSVLPLLSPLVFYSAVSTSYQGCISLICAFSHPLDGLAQGGVQWVHCLSGGRDTIPVTRVLSPELARQPTAGFWAPGTWWMVKHLLVLNECCGVNVSPKVCIWKPSSQGNSVERWDL